jgi:hypothetical protein
MAAKLDQLIDSQRTDVHANKAALPFCELLQEDGPPSEPSQSTLNWAISLKASTVPPLLLELLLQALRRINNSPAMFNLKSIVNRKNRVI